ncbi:hypothetical protein L1887_05934 [Cichorium endivia]|nr:hypothetical protein L1887_05934 [Cichorium endivia]
MEVTGRVLIATIVALFVVLILASLFHIYAKWLWYRRQRSIDAHNNHRRQDQHSGVTVLRRGLDASFLKTLPVIQFETKDFKDDLECSVCLAGLIFETDAKPELLYSRLSLILTRLSASQLSNMGKKHKRDIVDVSMEEDDHLQPQTTPEQSSKKKQKNKKIRERDETIDVKIETINGAC